MPKREYFPIALAGYGIFLNADDQILMHRRCNTGYRDGDYGLPAGHLESQEFALDGTIREVHEEVGILLTAEQLKPTHVQFRLCGDHERIDFFFTTREWSGEPKIMEPDKADDIQWFSLDELPKNIIPHEQEAILKSYQGIFFSEYEELENTLQ